jgi:hypothetical protein
MGNKFAIKIDWFNLRVEFSPNLKVLKHNSQSITGSGEVEETIIQVEDNLNNYNPKEYRTYVFADDRIIADEPWEPDSPWYQGLISGVGSKVEESPIIPTIAPARSATPAPKPQSVPQAVKKKEIDEQTLAQIEKLEQQLGSLKKMVSSLNDNFSKGAITQEQYLQKKDFLAKKMGEIVGVIEQLKG